MHESLSRSLRVALLLAALVPGASSAMSIIERYDRVTTIFPDSETFAGALQQSEMRQFNVPIAPGESITRNHTLNGVTVGDITWVGDSNIGVTITEIVTGSPTTVRARVTGTTGAAGYTTLVSQRERTSIIENGIHVFRRTGIGGFGGVTAGNPYIYEILLPGDWSEVGTTTGRHTLDAINPLWSIERNFVYDGSNTVFSARIASYMNDGQHDLDLSYSLYGVAAVPEPSAAVLMLLGCGFLASTVVRRSGQRKSSAHLRA